MHVTLLLWFYHTFIFFFYHYPFSLCLIPGLHKLTVPRSDSLSYFECCYATSLFIDANSGPKARGWSLALGRAILLIQKVNSSILRIFNLQLARWISSGGVLATTEVSQLHRRELGKGWLDGIDLCTKSGTHSHSPIISLANWSRDGHDKKTTHVGKLVQTMCLYFCLHCNIEGGNKGLDTVCNSANKFVAVS